MSAGNVLVTGASGFVGRYVVRDLAAAGMNVVGAARREFPVPPGASFRRIGDLANSETLDDAVCGTEFVVHLAARAHITRESAADPLAEFRHVNEEGTRRLAAAAARAGVRRFVLLSTVKALGETSGACALRDSDPPAPADPYGASKLRAEQALIDVARAEGFEFVILRAPLVYGPGVRANLLALLRAADTSLPLPFGAITGNRRSLIYLGNLASIIRLALQHPAAADQTFLVSDGADLSTAGLLACVRASLGRPRNLLNLPPFLIRAGLSGLGRSGAARRLLDSLQVDDTPLRDALGWQPPFSPCQGLAATAAWYRSQSGHMSESSTARGND